MKCPKCRYLSFEPELRCKHCGFDLSLAEPNPADRAFDELEPQEPDPPLVDLQLHPRRAAGAVALAERAEARVPRPAAVLRPARQLAGPTPDLPLFIKPNEIPAAMPLSLAETPAGDLDEPEVRVPAAPRPLAVRRRAPDSGRQPASAAPALVINRADRDLLDYLRRVETEAVPAAFPSAVPAPGDAVGVTARVKAVAIDLLLLTAVNGAVVLLTLRQCDLGVSQWAVMPLVPLVAFLVSLSVAYLLMFNVVGGQTIGKMMCGLRVVGDPIDATRDETPTPRQLSYRALLSVPSVLLLGLGFLPFLAGQDRTVHDRLTHTRVVRA